LGIRQITIAGCGTMGRGIAYLSAVAGYDTVLFDIDEKLLQAARENVATTLRKGVEKGKIEQAAADSALARISIMTDLEPAAHAADLVIEAIPESFDLKRDFFSQVDVFCGPSTILATNTSSLSITRLASSVERRDRFIGMHFFNPPHLMKLLEIVIGERTSAATLEEVRAVAIVMGKETITVKDSPGFATSRLGIAIGLEAMRMLEDGVASAADIDRAMELGYNHPMGPLRLSDLVGLDVRLSIADYLATTLGPRFEAPPILRKMIEQGQLGKKSGRGFYDWSEK
jgi:3-hydroxybutyryl-CoA dehydrogenase